MYSSLFSGDDITMFSRQINDGFNKQNERIHKIEEAMQTLEKRIEKLEQQQNSESNEKQ